MAQYMTNAIEIAATVERLLTGMSEPESSEVNVKVVKSAAPLITQFLCDVNRTAVALENIATALATIAVAQESMLRYQAADRGEKLL